MEDYSPGELSGLAHQLMERPSAVVMLASRLEERVHLCFARGEEVAADMGSLLRAAVSELGGKGGGRPSFAQGSAPLADRERVEEVLSKVSVK
jgi:alanyl-tRNA synthetase